MSLENFRLKVFRTVAEKRSFRLAAESLLLTQPAVTLQIKALEEELGVQLFDRAGQNIALTAAGQLLREYAERLAAIAAEAQSQIGELTGEQQGELRIAASTTIAQYVLPTLVGDFLALHPRVRPGILTGNTDMVVQRVAENAVDVGLVEGPAMRRDLKIEPFLSDQLMLIVPPRHPFAGRTQIQASDLAEQPLILREKGSGTRRIIERELRRFGLSPKRMKIALELDSTEAIKLAVEAGLGVGFVPLRATHKELKLGTLRQVAVDGLSLVRDFSLVYRRRPEPNGLPQVFLTFLRGVKGRDKSQKRDK
ncbi:MAG TPA: LysR substrate-binding domain-containing protein [Terriglobales bacterium]|nr:LysR substrate-binding domain-containing protein [Terriglobales bacterium]